MRNQYFSLISPALWPAVVPTLASVYLGTLVISSPAIALDCAEIGALAQRNSRCWESLPSIMGPKADNGDPHSPSTTPAIDAGDGLQPFQGVWKFDYEKTMEAHRESPDYKPEEDMEALSGLLNLMFGMVSLKISGNQLQMAATDSNEVITTIDCRVDSTTATMVTAQCTKEGDTKTIKFENVLPGQYMRFNAVGENDCPYCTWRRVEP
ncbi:hypothetical protein NON20_01585 [Synechocystis sp. B12]|nr:hypothetical protein NON20_01585 [Synechocystis sp. B12]